MKEGIDLFLWKRIANEVTFGINSIIYFFKPVVPFYGDWGFYKTNKQELDKYDLVIGMFDGKIGNGAHHKCQKGTNLTMLQTSKNYHGVDSWEKGFYSRVLTGMFALTVGIALGFKEIYLLGMDFCEINGKTHFYQKKILGKQKIGTYKKSSGKLQCGIGKDEKGNYHTGCYNKPSAKLYNEFKKVNPNVKIFNVSPKSKIEVFPKITYDEFFEILAEEPRHILQKRASLEIEKLIEKFRKPFV